MKIQELSNKVIKDFLVDYENDIKCNYTTTNGKLTKFKFSNSTKMLTYVENIEDLKNTHWSKHWEILKVKKFKISEIKKFLLHNYLRHKNN